MTKLGLVVSCLLLLSACSSDDDSSPVSTQSDPVLEGVVFPQTINVSVKGLIRPVASATTYNKEALIPPQCYTKHENQYNPCMVCHQTYDYRSRPNSMDDGDLQAEYAFSDIGTTNHWSNLFEDRSQLITQITDQEVIDYINVDNYSTLIEQLQESSDWSGPIPALENYALGAQAFDEQGFALDGSHWIAFNYKPLPGTFWPTNGATDDVLIRLPEAFRTSSCQGNVYSRDTYLANLSILEAVIKDLDSISVPVIDENEFCADLNDDGALSEISQINVVNAYVGAASSIEVHRMLYPQGTEFLHSVRYVGVDHQGDIVVPPHMKELRYMNKFNFYDEASLISMYGNERQEKIDELLPVYTHLGDQGTNNNFGWMVLGFIEAEDGHLRLQSEEEHLFCMGCHTTIGTTIDQTFAFPRKVTGAEGWGYINIKGMRDVPYVGGGPEGEIEHYLKAVGGGSEFRENDEIVDKFFNEDGSLKESKVRAADVYELITPSLRRALDLNKAYMTIVREQDFIYGRDANILPATNVYHAIDESVPVLPDDRQEQWDIRLEW